MGQDVYITAGSGVLFPDAAHYVPWDAPHISRFCKQDERSDLHLPSGHDVFFTFSYFVLKCANCPELQGDSAGSSKLLLTSKQKFCTGQNGTFVLKSMGGLELPAVSPCTVVVFHNPYFCHLWSKTESKDGTLCKRG